jgi:flagellin
MSSILTNNGAMVALQTLRSINSNLAKTQNEISTGKAVATAKDNAAVWAISKVMESDVSGFKAISDSLNLGRSTIAVARGAAGQVTELLKMMKEKIVASQEENVDRAKLQNELVSLRNQVTSIVSAAQFNGLNLLSNDRRTTALTPAGNVDGSGTVNVLASLDRSGTGVKSSDIQTRKQDLRTSAAVMGTGPVLNAAAFTAAGTAAANGATDATYTIVGETITGGRTRAIMAGDSYRFDMTLFDAAVPGTPFASAPVSKQTAIYVAKDGDTAADVARGLAAMINFRLAEQGFTNGEFNVRAAGANGNVLTITNNNATAMAAAAATNITTAHFGTVGGGLDILGELDISTKKGAGAALVAIEGLIQKSIDAGAAFGTAEKRLEIQNDFVTNLMDSLRSGIGSLVDADMEAVSARLQALQVQQQLGVQSLSIANQAPQRILALFR